MSVHPRDDINLTRLIQRLDKAVNGQDWNEASTTELWLKSLETLQTVKFSKRLLKNIDLPGISGEDSQRYENIRVRLEQFEMFLKSVEQRYKPRISKPQPLLPTLPKFALDMLNSESSKTLEEPPQISTDSLLISSADLPSASIVSPIPTLISPHFSTASKSTPMAKGAFLENSKARHEVMTEQLTQMALQLRKNAQNFSVKLAEDKVIAEETQTKLDSNHGFMLKERVRLRNHGGKSGYTTCHAIFAVVAVTVTFIFMVALIRLTRR